MTPELAETFVWVCPVDGCGYVDTEAQALRGHMAGRMRNDPAHHWDNVPIGHHDLEPAKVPASEFGLGAWTP